MKWHRWVDMTASRIIVLDDSLVTKIAAGEVVERPASVVKELVENSIDAGAARITVEIKNGGKKLIRVTDDGCGMTKDEAALSLERHSTSKIRTADDLFNIRTLGFRGEALPSISSISKLQLLTKVKDADIGTKVVSEGGKIREIADYGCPSGTTVNVEGLFFNTPARLKFMKSPNTEVSHILDIVSRFILCNPGISFRMINDGNEVISSSGSGKLTDSIASVYGLDIVDTLVEVKKDSSKIPVWGYISQPVISKSDRGGESIFVNGRYIRNMLLSRALEESYRNLIPNGKYPIAVMHIEIDPGKIDVNVHPTKREIKFERPDEVMSAVRRSVTDSLSRLAPSDVAVPHQGYDLGNKREPDQADELRMFGPENAQVQNLESLHPQEELDGFKILAQISRTYIIVAKGNELIIIDQHAAHERILYEKLRSKDFSGSQRLLINQTIELPPSDFTVLMDNLDFASSLGFDLEPFGKNTFIVRAIPSAIEFNQAKEAIEEIMSDLVETLKIRDSTRKKDEALKMLACKGAVKAGDELGYEEMRKLVSDLLNMEFATTCPHGRPAIFRLSVNDLEKIFKRK